MKSGGATASSNQLSQAPGGGYNSSTPNRDDIDALHIIRQSHGLWQPNGLAAVAPEYRTVFHDRVPWQSRRIKSETFESAAA